MGKVTATGIYLGHRLTVEVTKENQTVIVTFDGMDVPDLQDHFNELLEHQLPIGGTYYPDENSLLAAYNVLNTTFFDSLEHIEVEGEVEEIPYEENKIY